ncbi:hypothetical protein BDQ17DRAFT_1365877, partial [Cyathus striatus]
MPLLAVEILLHLALVVVGLVPHHLLVLGMGVVVGMFDPCLHHLTCFNVKINQSLKQGLCLKTQLHSPFTVIIMEYVNTVIYH